MLKIFTYYIYYLKIIITDFKYKIGPFKIKKKLRKENIKLIKKFTLKSYIKCINNNKVKKDILGFKYALYMNLLLQNRQRGNVLYIKQKRIYFLNYFTLNFYKILLYIYIYALFFHENSSLRNYLIKYNNTLDNKINLNIINYISLLPFFFDLNLIDKKEKRHLIIEIEINHFYAKKFKLDFLKFNKYVLSLLHIMTKKDIINKYYITFKQNNLKNEKEF